MIEKNQAPYKTKGPVISVSIWSLINTFSLRIYPCFDYMRIIEVECRHPAAICIA